MITYMLHVPSTWIMTLRFASNKGCFESQRTQHKFLVNTGKFIYFIYFLCILFDYPSYQCISNTLLLDNTEKCDRSISVITTMRLFGQIYNIGEKMIHLRTDTKWYNTYPWNLELLLQLGLFIPFRLLAL